MRVLACLATATAGVALFLGTTVSAQSTPVNNDCSLDHLNRASLQNVAIMSLDDPPASDSTIDAMKSAIQRRNLNEAMKMLEASALGLPSGGEVLGYTRLRLHYTPCTNLQTRNYDEESRSAIERFFVGKVDNHVLKLDAIVEPTGVKASSQLYSMLRTSAKDGQSWTTDVRNNDYLLPYFRIDKSSTLSFSANFQSEGSSKVDAAGSLLDIVERGSSLIAPHAILITDANMPRFNDAASFVDESLSRLFYKKVSETARQGIAISPTQNEAHRLARIVLVSPHPTKTYATQTMAGRVVGQWEIYADKLIKSLFISFNSGNPDYSNLDAASVLNFKISDGEVLRDRLAKSEAIAKAAQALAKADAKSVADPATGFCRLVSVEAAKLGLAPYDVAIATWAYLADQAMVAAKHDAAHTACSVISHFPPQAQLNS